MSPIAREIPAPLSAINTTPLIDVLLVLLVMMIITIPVGTDQTEFDLPGGSTATVDTHRNTLVVTRDDTITWNGGAISTGELGSLLHETTLLPTEPTLEFKPDAQASYDRSAKVLAMVKAAGVTKFGFAGNEAYADSISSGN